MAFWTVIGKTNGDPQRSFGITLNTDAKSWTASGPGVDYAFNTKSGSYVIKPVPDLGTSLLTSSGAVAAFIRNLHGASAVGDTGSGNLFEKGETFGWKLDSK